METKLGKYTYANKKVGEIQINALLPLGCLLSHSQIISSDSWRFGYLTSDPITSSLIKGLVFCFIFLSSASAFVIYPREIRNTDDV